MRGAWREKWDVWHRNAVNRPMLFGETQAATMELGAILYVTETVFCPGGVPLVADDLTFKIPTLHPEQIPTLELLQFHHALYLSARYTHAASGTIV